MPRKNGHLTTQETKFAAVFADTGNAQHAGREAGFSRPDAHSYTVLKRPAVQGEIARIQMERLNNTLLPLAVGAIERLLTDKRTPAGAVVQAAKLVMDRTLGSDDNSRKDPHEMTGDELTKQLDRLREEATKRGKIIDVTPESAAQSGVFD